MNDKWIDFAIRIQSIAQAGLQYGKDKFDKSLDRFIKPKMRGLK